MHIGGLKCVGGSGSVRIGFPVLLERVLVSRNVFYMIEQWMVSIGGLAYALFPTMQIASLGEGKEARRIHLDLCSSTVFENYGSMIKQWGGWTFGFDSDIPRVTISGRFCDWTGSRGLHLLVSEPGYAITGKVSEIQAPIAYTTIENVVLVKRLEQIGSLPLLTHISLFNGNEEILPPPSVGGEIDLRFGYYQLKVREQDVLRTAFRTSIQRAPVCWAETRQKLSPLVDILKVTTEKVKLICDRLKTASDRQKSYVDLKRREIEYVVGDRVFLKVLPWKKVMRFGRKGKLSPRYIGPYEIVERVGSVTYRLLLPLEEIELNPDLSYDEEPVEILASDSKVLRGRTIELVKVKWRHRGVEEATWERKKI
ncbi:hypothetical protein GQ457_10G006700 [Hibiscus cannabinus]